MPYKINSNIDPASS